jgi:hypothetical protein
MTLSIYDFGSRLLSAGDLDPVYTLVWHAGLDDKLCPWLLAYWCFYDVGTASWITEHRDYWLAMEMAAGSKEYHRGRERRHFRGVNAEKSVAYLRGIGLEELFARLVEPIRSTPSGLDVKTIMSRVQMWVGFGPWIAFKVADMLERLAVCEVHFDDAAMFLFESPRKGAEMLWVTEHDNEENIPDGVGQRAVSQVIDRMKVYKSPPRYERPINAQEAETLLCKWHAYMNGHYHVGEDVVACRRSLLRYARCKTAQRLLAAGRRGGLW